MPSLQPRRLRPKTVGKYCSPD
uniref:Uncharacterized protein n=1 Tax=Arundo donax TaxID=35708 RepID=A0A0A9FLX6_ARUDO